MSNSTGICINLDNSRSARAFSGQESLWAKDLFRILKLIAQHAAQQSRSSNTGGEEPSKDQPRLSIAIFGPSGSGKSSLLSTLHREVQECKKKEEELFSAGRVLESLEVSEPTNSGSAARTANTYKEILRTFHKDVATLPILRPDTFAEDDHFLYAFLARALEADREPLQGKRSTDADSEVLSSLQRQFQELSDFLRVLDPTEKTQDYDPLGLSLERMERHTSGLLLRDKLRQFIDLLANSLDCKVILLPVDDVDMAPEHMVEILKIYQAFLIHPRLVPIFTFTDRTAEEVLRVHYQKFLSGGMEVYEEPGEDANRLNVSEKLSLQYLARCFPVRNRIRLGPAPARLQQARFVRNDPEVPNQDGTQVLDLLKTANFLLFGHHDWQDTHEVRAILRPSTLRRQLHVMDALVEAEIENYIVDQFRGKDEQHSQNNTEAPEKGRKPWALAYNRATWALLNVHRDVLREYDLFLEDLYSWSPRALRRVVLDTLLGQPIDVRRSLLRRWRDRADSRRSQVLSMLAANVFKPWTPVEEAYGDDEYAFSPENNLEITEETEGNIGLRADAVLQWFLELTIGFYMPIALARPQQEGSMRDAGPARRRVIGIGWGLESGPVNAVRDADERQNMLPTGICFLNPKKFQSKLEKDPQQRENHAQPQNELTLRLWCFYGFSRGRFWSAVSFWRGLGLIARVLDRHRRLRYELATLHLDQKTKREDQWKKELRVLIRHHLLRGIIPADMLGKVCDEKDLQGTAFKRWDSWEKGTDEQSTDAIDNLVEELVRWLGSDEEDDRKAREGWENEVLPSMPPPAGTDDSDSSKNHGKKFGWRNNFTRRLHGSDILGDFWQRLAITYIEKQDDYPKAVEGKYGWTVGVALLSWTHTLLDYWRGTYTIQRLLRSCPLLRPFTSGPSASTLRKELLDKDYQDLKSRHKTADFPSLNTLLEEELHEKGDPALELSPGEDEIKICDLVKFVSKRLQELLNDWLIMWGCKDQRIGGTIPKTQLNSFESDLMDHWKWIGAPFSKDEGPDGGEKTGSITRESARTLFHDQLRELYWANKDFLAVRWFWDLERVKWEEFKTQKEKS